VPLREALIFGAFLLLCAVGVATVVLPEGRAETAEGAPAPTSTSAEQPSDSAPVQ
jgi:hypothetical protein